MGSPLTAEPFDALLEIEMGDFVGKVRQEVYTEAILASMKSDYWHFAPPNGESSRQVEERMVTFLEEVVFPKVMKKEKEGSQKDFFRVAIFGHGYAFKCLLRHVLKLDPSETYNLVISNTSVTEIEFSPSHDARIVSNNDVSHLTSNNIKST